jgi:DNA-binding PadR family transcriptional regulator
LTAELSDNQVRLMAALRKTGGSATTRALGAVRDAGRMALGADAARKVLGRLEARGLVAGDGKGTSRVWILTEAGRELLEAARPSRDSEDGSPVRTYYVFEQVELEELLRRLEVEHDPMSLPDDVVVYRRVADVEARNTTHAYRIAGAEVFAGRDVRPMCVAVADRMFQPKRLRVRNRTEVGVT